ncbi:MAG TPA: C25 family cysteine peptidase [Dokdonella sp.]|jgi:hypothetical protein|nr:C25 family cysteine peptidase [Dokdonella sp.]
MPPSPTWRSLAHLLCLLPLPAFACGGSLHIELENSAVYSLDYAEIAARQPGLADCAIDALSLENRGQPVALRVVDDGDGRFGEGDRIEWVGKQLHGPQSWFDTYAINNVYLLSASPGPHVRMVDRLPAGEDGARLRRKLHLEQENLMIRLDQSQQKPGEEPDVWHWVKLTHADPAPFTTDFDLPDLATGGSEVSLRLNFRGMSNIVVPWNHKLGRPDDHVVEIRINGKLLKGSRWNGRDEFVQDMAVPVAWLKAKANSLTLSVPKRALPWKKEQSAVDVVMFNWVEMDYPLAGNLDAGDQPMQTHASDERSLQLYWSGPGEAPALYGDDGVRRPAQALGQGRYRYAAAAGNVTLYPATRLASPTAIRAVSAKDWHSPEKGYDYLIVSHSSLIDAIRPLAAFHEKRGMRVAVLDIDDVYDEFNFGITHPQAVRNLVDHAWHNWPQPRPRFLLLVGDASFDIRHDTYNDLAYAKFANSPQELLPGQFSGIPATSYDQVGGHTGMRNLVPTWQYPSPEGQSASDNWFGAVDGDDYHPVVAVGRFPVVTPAEVTAIVDKTINYMTHPKPGVWRRDVMFITDESDYFKKASDQIASSIGAMGFLADKIYASPEEADNLAHQSAIKDGLNAGQLLVHFIGHGGRYIWRTGPPDLRKNHDLFTLDDVSQLKNSGRLPMILSMTCYSAPFDNPTEDSIGERFLREADKGAVAVFAASWRNSPSTTFSKSLVSELLVPGGTIGEGILRSKRSIEDRTLVEMYNLLGDPAIVLERPRSDARLQLGTDRWKPSVLVALPGPDFHGLVAMDWLDGENTLLSTTVMRADQAVFSVPVPKFADGKFARFARVYANNERAGWDASAGLDMTVLAARGQPRSRWPAWLRFGAKSLPDDTVSRRGFEEYESVPERAE